MVRNKKRQKEIKREKKRKKEKKREKKRKKKKKNIFNVFYVLFFVFPILTLVSPSFLCYFQAELPVTRIGSASWQQLTVTVTVQFDKSQDTAVQHDNT